MRFGLEASTIENLSQLFKDNEKINTVVIYGSRAKGNYKRGSDIDLCIMDEEFGFRDRLTLGRMIDDLMLPYNVDLCVYNELKNVELIAHIDRAGKPFYQR